ncbi:MAG: cbb3-type cytochrome oxidase assembly protein CcoS [Polyangiales bacterium]
MDVLILLIFISLVLVVGAVASFAKTLKDGSFEHADRLSLLPLRDDDPRPREESSQGLQQEQ